MTEQEFNTLKSGSTIYMYFDAMSQNEDFARFHVNEVKSTYIKAILMSDIGGTAKAKERKIYKNNCPEFYVSLIQCKIQKIRDVERDNNGTIRKYKSNIKKLENELENLKMKLGYNELLENYPEEFI